MITRAIAEKIRDIVDAGLVRGVGIAEPGKLCVEAAVCYRLALGLCLWGGFWLMFRIIFE